MLINLIALEKIDRSPRVASQARVEQLVRIWEARPVGKGKLHLLFVGVADRDDSVARPHWASHPLPFLDDLPVGLQDALADAGERFATPVCDACAQLVNTFCWIHWYASSCCSVFHANSFIVKFALKAPVHPGEILREEFMVPRMDQERT